MEGVQVLDTREQRDRCSIWRPELLGAEVDDILACLSDPALFPALFKNGLICRRFAHASDPPQELLCCPPIIPQTKDHLGCCPELPGDLGRRIAAIAPVKLADHVRHLSEWHRRDGREWQDAEAA